MEITVLQKVLDGIWEMYGLTAHVTRIEGYRVYMSDGSIVGFDTDGELY